jgi:hypothetical protein
MRRTEPILPIGTARSVKQAADQFSINPPGLQFRTPRAPSGPGKSDFKRPKMH